MEEPSGSLIDRLISRDGSFADSFQNELIQADLGSNNMNIFAFNLAFLFVGFIEGNVSFIYQSIFLLILRILNFLQSASKSMESLKPNYFMTNMKMQHVCLQYRKTAMVIVLYLYSRLFISNLNTNAILNVS